MRVRPRNINGRVQRAAPLPYQLPGRQAAEHGAPEGLGKGRSHHYANLPSSKHEARVGAGGISRRGLIRAGVEQGDPSGLKVSGPSSAAGFGSTPSS